MKQITTEVLVVGGGVGGSAAAIQAARMGAQVILVSEFAWLGGMLTTAGVTAPDGNELDAWRTGLWGAFLTELLQRETKGLDHGWVSFFTYEPRIGAAIFADWVKSLPNLQWIQPQTPQAVLRDGDRILGVRFEDYEIRADITIDGTELGDLLALGDIPHRWGWEFQAEFNEPSAPAAPNATTQRYSVQAPTWVVVMQDFGPGAIAPAIPAPPNYDPTPFHNAWTNYGPENCLDYGRLPGDRFMINWPIHGNDYGEGVDRLIGDRNDRAAFFEEARQYSQGFAHYIQTQVDRRYGLAEGTFDKTDSAFAFHPYYRESRRLIGLTTIREQDLLPQFDGQSAALPITTSAAGCENVEQCCDAIAIGNYANDHHYPSGDIPLAPKSIRWGGRWTGTPFTIPYRSLIPKTVNGFLACEKNISTSHMSNGATRLQPCVFGIGQAAGAAAALCIDRACQPRDLPIQLLQNTLLTDSTAPNAIIPLYNLPPHHPEWLRWQQYYLEHCGSYPRSAYAPISPLPPTQQQSSSAQTYSGQFLRNAPQEYNLAIAPDDIWQLVTTDAAINQYLLEYKNEHKITFIGRKNTSGRWIVVEYLLEV